MVKFEVNSNIIIHYYAKRFFNAKGFACADSDVSASLQVLTSK
jgi:hypothetical protein